MAENQDNRSASNGERRQNPADNLSHADRVRGGERSSRMQRRDGQGQFAGRQSGEVSQQASSDNPERSNRGGRSGHEGGSRGGAEGGLQT